MVKHSNFFPVVFSILVVAAIGCGSKLSSGPFGAPTASPLLSPFAGKWVFEFEKTLDALSSSGVEEKQITQLRKLYTTNPALGKMHPDISFQGNEAVGVGLLSSEYRFFRMHKHGSKICGKAWHHEDRFDPGDMSKCFVRLEIIGGELHMEVNMHDGLPALSDPDLVSEPPSESDVSTCDVDTKAGNQPGDWMTYVFTRG